MEGSKRPRRHRRVREKDAPRYETPAAAALSGVLFDSDVIIEILRGRPATVRSAQALEAAHVPTFCTPITWAEVYAGLRQGEESATQAFLEARGEVPLTAAIGRRAGVYLARYARSHGVEIADALIAAAATTADLRLWTLNRKHYPMDDLRFYDPA